jgi:uncharacterized paraquat-inducible protein A
VGVLLGLIAFGLFFVAPFLAGYRMGTRMNPRTWWIVVFFLGWLGVLLLYVQSRYWKPKPVSSVDAERGEAQECRQCGYMARSTTRVCPRCGTEFGVA